MHQTPDILGGVEKFLHNVATKIEAQELKALIQNRNELEWKYKGRGVPDLPNHFLAPTSDRKSVVRG
jgi:hypothetical protein